MELDTSKDDATAEPFLEAERGMDAAGEIWLDGRTTIVAVCRSAEA